MISADQALPGRDEKMAVPARHFVLGTPMSPPFPGMELALFGMGCFWGAERAFWQLDGVHSTAVGYAAGFTPSVDVAEVAEAAWAGILGCHLLSSTIGGDPYTRLARTWRVMLFPIIPEHARERFDELLERTAAKFQARV